MPEKIYEETLNGVKAELSGRSRRKSGKERLVKNRWEKMRVERKIVVVSILAILVSLVFVTSYGRWMDFGSFLLVMAAVAVVSVWWISHLFRKAFQTQSGRLDAGSKRGVIT